MAEQFHRLCKNWNSYRGCQEYKFDNIYHCKLDEGKCCDKFNKYNIDRNKLIPNYRPSRFDYINCASCMNRQSECMKFLWHNDCYCKLLGDEMNSDTRVDFSFICDKYNKRVD